MDVENLDEALEETAEANVAMEETYSAESSQLNQIGKDASDLAKEKDCVMLFDHKRKELDKIQYDLNELMVRLNNFISDSQDESADEDPTSEHQDESEKQDGPQEKELFKKNSRESISADEIYTCDGLSPPEVNWDVLAPYIQNVVGDLQKIRNLNQMTNSVLERIRNITGPEDAAE